MTHAAIHRVNLPVQDYQRVTLTGLPISVAAARNGSSDEFDMWFEHAEPPFSIGVYVLGTGHPTPWADQFDRPRFAFVGTIVTPSELVWHVYTGPVK